MKRWSYSRNTVDWDLQVEALGALVRGKALSMAQSVSFDPKVNMLDIAKYGMTHRRFRLWLCRSFRRYSRRLGYRMSSAVCLARNIACAISTSFLVSLSGDGDSEICYRSLFASAATDRGRGKRISSIERLYSRNGDQAVPYLDWDKRPLSEQVLRYSAVLVGIPEDALIIYIALSVDGLELHTIKHSGNLRCT